MWTFTERDIQKIQRVGRRVSGTSKITKDDVLNIRRSVRRGVSKHDLAAQYGISYRQVNRIVAGDRWKRYREFLPKNKKDAA